MNKRKVIRHHHELEVYQQAFDLAMRIFDLTKNFPLEEKYSLTDQIRRSSRSMCANIAEAWRRRRYKNAFISKLNDSEAEAAETQTWIQFSVKCGYLQREIGEELYLVADNIIGKLVNLIRNPEPWLMNKNIKKLSTAPKAPKLLHIEID